MKSTHAALVTAAAALAVADLLQAGALAAWLASGAWPPSAPRAPAWAALSAAAGLAGLVAAYRSIRSGVARRAFWGLLIVPYCFALNVRGLRLGWALQVAVGRFLGDVGVSLNLLGLVLLACWLQLFHVPRHRARHVASSATSQV